MGLCISRLPLLNGEGDPNGGFGPEPRHLVRTVSGLIQGSWLVGNREAVPARDGTLHRQAARVEPGGGIESEARASNKPPCSRRPGAGPNHLIPAGSGPKQ